MKQKMNLENAKKLLAQVDKAGLILDDIASISGVDLDLLPTEINDIVEAAWRATQEARIKVGFWVDTLSKQNTDTP